MKPKLYKIGKYFKNITFPYKLLPYWIEEQSKIWTKLSLNPGESKSFYIYYSLKDNTPKDPFNDNSEVAFYRFNGNANDEYNTYNGTWNGNEQYSGGVWDKGAKFDGSSKIESNLDINSYPAITFSFWLNFSFTNDAKPVGFSGSQDMAIQIVSGTTARVYFRSNLNYSDISNFFINNNTWNFYAFVIDSNGTKHYRNGILIATSNQQKSTVTNNFTIGNVVDYNGNDNYYNGFIDNLRIFNRVLTDEEVQQLYNLEKPYFIKQEPEKIFEFFDDFEGNDLDSEKWEIGSGPYSVENSYIKMWGAYGASGDVYSILHKIKNTFLIPFQIIWKGKCSTSGDIDVGITLFKNSNNSAIARSQLDNEGGASDWFRWVAINVNTVGYHNSELAGTEWRLCNTKVYSDKLEFIVKGLTPLNTTYDFSSIGEIKIGIYGDTEVADRIGYIDYIAIAKLIDQELSISYSPEEFKFLSLKRNIYTKRKLITITNTSSDPLIDYQIPLDYSQINYDNIILVETLEEEE